MLRAKLEYHFCGECDEVTIHETYLIKSENNACRIDYICEDCLAETHEFETPTETIRLRFLSAQQID